VFWFSADRVIVQCYRWQLYIGWPPKMYVTLLFSFVLISILCPWSFNCWNMLNFSYFCVISVWTWCYAHMQLLTILICFMQVRCIIRNIVRDWAEEVIFCSTDMNIEKYCCFIYLFIYLFILFQGQKERDECYKPILEELNRLFPNRSDGR
jgi:hypothetical protein